MFIGEQMASMQQHWREKLSYHHHGTSSPYIPAMQPNLLLRITRHVTKWSAVTGSQVDWAKTCIWEK